MSTQPDTSDSDTPSLGSRENFWGRDNTEDHEGGHRECSGTDPAEWVAHQLALRFCTPICGETGGELSDPEFYLPKQIEIAEGIFLEYRQHRNRRRVEPESGRINWGESTSTEVPEFEYPTFCRCVGTYLTEKDYRLSNREDYLEYADTVWHDPTMGSKDSLAQFVRYVRDREQE
jgi:hypothetical protein